VALTSIPRPRARPVSKTAPMPSASPPMPPVVVFSLPLDGEAGIPPSSVFAVQFSKDMDVESFRGRVLLRYAGSRRQGDHPFESLSLRYDAGRRVLRIDPGDVLRPGRDLEILLLPGIRDKDGLDLAVRSGRENEGAVDILKYRTGT
jgi:hypothetical protein